MATTLRLETAIEQRLSALAALTGRTKAYYIRTAIEEKLEEMEDIYLAEKRLENPGRIWTMKQMEQEFGLAD